jgi:hypothetical protein
MMRRRSWRRRGVRHDVVCLVHIFIIRQLLWHIYIGLCRRVWILTVWRGVVTEVWLIWIQISEFVGSFFAATQELNKLVVKPVFPEESLEIERN